MNACHPGAASPSRPMIVVDTNVVAELMRPEPNESVRNWSLALPSDESYTSPAWTCSHSVRSGTSRSSAQW